MVMNPMSSAGSLSLNKSDSRLLSAVVLTELRPLLKV